MLSSPYPDFDENMISVFATEDVEFGIVKNVEIACFRSEERSTTGQDVAGRRFDAFDVSSKTSADWLKSG